MSHIFRQSLLVVGIGVRNGRNGTQTAAINCRVVTTQHSVVLNCNCYPILFSIHFQCFLLLQTFSDLFYASNCLCVPSPPHPFHIHSLYYFNCCLHLTFEESFPYCKWYISLEIQALYQIELKLETHCNQSSLALNFMTSIGWPSECWSLKVFIKSGAKQTETKFIPIDIN